MSQRSDLAMLGSLLAPNAREDVMGAPDYELVNILGAIAAVNPAAAAALARRVQPGIPTIVPSQGAPYIATAENIAAAQKAGLIATPVLPVPRTPVNGSAEPSIKELPMGLGSVAFGVAGTAATLTSPPAQRNGRPTRLTLVEAPVGTPAGGQVLVVTIQIGVDIQAVGTAGMPIETFGPTATDFPLSTNPIQVGQACTINFTRTAAPGAGNDIIVSGTLRCQAVT